MTNIVRANSEAEITVEGMTLIIFKFKDKIPKEEKQWISEELQVQGKNGIFIVDERITVIVITDDGVEVIE